MHTFEKRSHVQEEILLHKSDIICKTSNLLCGNDHAKFLCGSVNFPVLGKDL